MAYEEVFSPKIEKMLKNAVGKVLKLNPILAKDLRQQGSADLFCTRVCRPIKEATECIVDLTYANTSAGFELGIAQGFKKPVIVTRYMSGKKSLTNEEKKLLKELPKLKEKGIIQFFEIPCQIPADISSVYRIDYKNEKELQEGLKKGFEVK